MRLNDEMPIRIYRAVLDTNCVLAVSQSVFADALDRAVRDGLKAMDAVHVTIAERHGCQRFVTTDPHFRSLTSIIPELIALPVG
jgi:predicted nucleic acid-binding protein